MKLRPKRKAQLEAEKQKKDQILQGVRIAEKVDTVRQTLATEEKNLENFRKESISQVQREIDGKIAYKNQLSDEISELEEQRRIARIPLDAEWQRVQQENARLNGVSAGLFEREEALDQRTEQVLQKEKSVDLEKQRAEDMKKEAEKQLQEADKILKSAREDAAQMRNSAQVALSNAEEREAKVAEKERVIEITLEDIDRREQAIKDEREEIANEKRALKDGYETLERSINRMNHGRRSSNSSAELGSDEYPINSK